MAKKRQQKQVMKEEREFEFPEFDKEEFMREEMRGAKTTLIGAGFGVVMAVVSFGIAYASPGVAFLVGLASMGLLKFVFESANIDLTEFGWKGWGGSFAVYFFTWLLVWVLISNPPFSDLADPEVHGSGVFGPRIEDGNLTGELIQPEEPIFNLVDNDTMSMTNIIERNGIDTPINHIVARTVYIVTIATDNDELSSVVITIIYNGTSIINGQSMAEIGTDGYNVSDRDLEDEWEPREDYAFGFILGSEHIRAGTYDYIITAKDVNGKKTEFTSGFVING